MSAVSKQEVLEFLYAKARTFCDKDVVHWTDTDATAEFVEFQRDTLGREEPFADEKLISLAITAELASISTALMNEVSVAASWRKLHKKNAFHYGRRVNFKAIFLHLQSSASETPDALPSNSPEHSGTRDEDVDSITKRLLEEVRDLKRLQFEIRRSMDRDSTKYFTWKRNEVPTVERFDLEALRKSLNSDLYVQMLDVLGVKPTILSYRFDALFKHPATNEEFVLKDIPAGFTARDGRYAYKVKKFIREKEIHV